MDNELVARITAGDMVTMFKQAGRGNQFSREALYALLDYYDQLADDIGEPIALDVIGVCCDWAEYDDLAELRGEYASWRTITTEPLTTGGITTTTVLVPRVPFKRYEPSGLRSELMEEQASPLHDETTVIELSTGGYLVHVH